MSRVNKPKVNILIIVQFLREGKKHIQRWLNMTVFKMWNWLGMNIKVFFLFVFFVFYHRPMCIISDFLFKNKAYFLFYVRL